MAAEREPLSRFPTAKGWEDLGQQATHPHHKKTNSNNNALANAVTAGSTTGAAGVAATATRTREIESFSTSLGPFVRLWGIEVADLPSSSASSEELRPFLAAVLSEAYPFIDSATPMSRVSLAGADWKPAGGSGKGKKHKDSNAVVERSSRVVSARELDGVVEGYETRIREGKVLGRSLTLGSAVGGDSGLGVAVADGNWNGNGDQGGSGSGGMLGADLEEELSRARLDSVAGDVSPGNVSIHHQQTKEEDDRLRRLKKRRERVLRDGKQGEETWFCRRSVHEDAAKRGTASWDEFEQFHKREHMRVEKEMTPDVVAAHEAVGWTGTKGVEISLARGNQDNGAKETWHDFTMSILEMKHKVGRPLLKDRTFPVLQITCKVKSKGKEGESNSLGVSSQQEQTEDHLQPPGVTLTQSTTAEAFSRAAGQQQSVSMALPQTKPPATNVSSNEPHEFLVVRVPVIDFGKDERSKLAKESGSQVAIYVSVERIRRMKDSQIEWVMATASDAGGSLPMWVQTAAVPGLLWKDVPMFFSWIAKTRSGNA